MTDILTSTMDEKPIRGQILEGTEPLRHRSPTEKLRIVEETYAPGVTVSLVARQHGIAPNQLFTWRRLAAQGALTAAEAGEEVVPASDYRALQAQVRELQRLLGNKTLESEILKEALEQASPKKRTLRSLSLPKDGSMSNE